MVTFKQRLTRFFDRLSNRIRPAHVPLPEGDHQVTVAGVRVGDGLELVEFSLVTHCPYCGSDDWDTPMTKPDGSVCRHPTRLRVVK